MKTNNLVRFLAFLGLTKLVLFNYISGAEPFNGPSLETQKEMAAHELRVKNSLKATKASPQSSSWTKIYDQSGINFYFDRALIKQDGLYVSIPYLVDLPVPDEINLLTDGRHAYQSLISVVNYDCSRRSLPPQSERYWANEDDFFFTERMAAGELMMDPSRSKKKEWVAGFDSPGMTYGGKGGQVNQTYFINRVLNPELKICQTFWKAPDGFKPAKTPPYTQLKDPICIPARQDGKTLDFNYCSITTSAKTRSDSGGENKVFINPGTYTGEYRSGYPSGYGTYLVQSGELAGDLYLGFFSGGNFDGYGTYYHNANNSLKGSMYIGYFKNHKKEGPGIYTFADGSPAQEGEWKEDRLVTPQKIVFKDTLRGLPMCQGDDALAWTDCFGYLRFESILGQVLSKPGGTTYAGAFKDGLPDGVGSFFHGDRHDIGYQGEIKSGLANGIGAEINSYTGQASYYGGYFEDKHHGKGRSVTGGGSTPLTIYEGDYVYGARSGQGTLTVEKNYTYVGGFKGSKFDGHGVYTPERLPGGVVAVKEGMWQDGNLLKAGEEYSDGKTPKKRKGK